MQAPSAWMAATDAVVYADCEERINSWQVMHAEFICRGQTAYNKWAVLGADRNPANVADRVCRTPGSDECGCLHGGIRCRRRLHPEGRAWSTILVFPGII